MCAKVLYYEAERTDEGVSLWVYNSKRVLLRQITPAASLKIRDHSPTGFEFGYGGSGPAQLALAILLDCLKDAKLAQNLHQGFKWKFLATAQGDRVVVSSLQVLSWATDMIVCVPTTNPSAN